MTENTGSSFEETVIAKSAWNYASACSDMPHQWGGWMKPPDNFNT